MVLCIALSSPLTRSPTCKQPSYAFPDADKAPLVQHVSCSLMYVSGLCTLSPKLKG